MVFSSWPPRSPWRGQDDAHAGTFSATTAAASAPASAAPFAPALGARSAIGPEVAAPVLADERTALLDVFPDGIVEEAYALDVTVTLRPPASS
ncbi:MULTISPECIES: hypothetical protein [Streptomyces]|uniref:hypothetical protein n=1 Tax=Streptomyces TaxID=1883 RepID=UPI003429A66E